MPWKRKRCWTADAFCRLDSSLTPQYDSEQDLGSRSDPLGRGIQRGRQNRSFRDSCRRSLSLRTAHTEGSFPTGPACRGIFCADHIGCACGEFPSSRPRRLHSSKQWNAPRRNGLCRCQCFSTIPAGGRNRFLGTEVLAGQTAHALSARTVSTTRSQTSPSDPRRSIRGSPLTRSEWLSFRGSRTPSLPQSCSRPLSILDRGPCTCLPALRGANHQRTHHQSNTHPRPRCAHSNCACDILAQWAAAANKEQ